METVEKHLWKVAASHQGYLNENIPILLLSIRASTHDTTDLTRLVCVRERIPTALRSAVWGTPDKERPTIDHTANLTDHLHDTHIHAHQHLKLASAGMKTRYDWLANCVGYHEGDKARLYRPTCKKGKSPKLQFSREDPCKVVAWINYVVYRIQWNLDWGWWWNTWTDSWVIRESLGTSGLKEGAVRAVGELSPWAPSHREGRRSRSQTSLVQPSEKRWWHACISLCNAGPSILKRGGLR
jgi:hypothetical protein